MLWWTVSDSRNFHAALPPALEQTKTLLRPVRNWVLHGGYSPPVSRLLGEYAPQPDADGYSVNLSFDLELSLNSPFWRGETTKALVLGTAARRNYPAVLALLIDNATEFNVQVVGGLLDRNLAAEDFFSREQRELIAQHPDLFSLPAETIDMLASDSVAAGIHGYSHRLFDTLTEPDADAEIGRTIALLKQTTGRDARFISFPKNQCAHTHLLAPHGLTRWRGATSRSSVSGEIPIGLWFAKPMVSAGDLNRLLRKLRSETNGFCLHLWNHFHERTADDFRRYIDVLLANDFRFRSL